DTTGKQKANDSEELHGDGGKADAQYSRSDDANQNGLLALICREACGSQPDDDCVVAGEHEINGDDLQERCKSRSRENLHCVGNLSRSRIFRMGLSLAFVQRQAGCRCTRSANGPGSRKCKNPRSTCNSRIRYIMELF